MHFQCAPHILLSASHQAAGLSTTGLQIALHATRSPVALKIRKLTPTWLRRFDGSFQILRKSCEEVKSGFGFDVVYADDVLSVITVFINFVLQPDSDCTGVCDITVSGLNFQDGLPVVVRNGDLLWGGAAAYRGEVVDGFIAADCLIARACGYIESVTS